MTTTKKVALTDPPKVFKSIRVRKIFYENGEGKMEIKSRQVTGHLNYLRLYYPGYDHKVGDELDRKIFEKAQATFIDAGLVINNLLVLEGQLDDYITQTRGNLVQRVITTISPSIPYEEVAALVGKQFTQYNLTLKLKLQTTWDKIPSDREDSYFEYFDIPIYYKEIDKLAMTIQPI
jgi:hypothetical protein